MRRDRNRPYGSRGRFAAVCLVLCVSLCGCGEETILHGVGEREAHLVRLVLFDVGISSTLEKAGEDWNIEVPQQHVTAALRELERRHVLRRHERKPANAGSMFETLEDQRERLATARSIELENTIRTIPAIVDVRIHIVPELEYSPLRPRNTEPGGSATAVVVVEGDSNSESFKLIEKQVQGILESAAGVTGARVFVSALAPHEKEPSIPSAIAPPPQSALLENRTAESSVTTPVTHIVLLAFVVVAFMAFAVLAVRRWLLKRSLGSQQLGPRTYQPHPEPAW